MTKRDATQQFATTIPDYIAHLNTEISYQYIRNQSYEIYAISDGEFLGSISLSFDYPNKEVHLSYNTYDAVIGVDKSLEENVNALRGLATFFTKDVGI